MELESGPLSAEDFKAFAKKVVLFCHITSRVQGEKYAELSSEKGGSGWPYVCFLDQDGNVIARQDHRKLRAGAAAFTDTLQTEVAQFFELQRLAESGDKAAQAEFLMLRFELGHLSRADMEGALARKDFLGEEQIAEIKAKLMEMQVRDLVVQVENKATTEYGEVATKLLEMHKTTGLPEGPAGIEPWRVILEDAWHRRDAKTFEMAFTAIQAAGFRSKAFVEKRRQQLAELKGAAKQ